MIKHIEIENFKIHKHLEIDLGGLTLLTGMNSSGKSSVLQSFLLLRDNRQSLQRGLSLNGDLYDGGFSEDVFNAAAENDEMTFAINTSKGDISLSYKVPMGSVKKNYIECSESKVIDNMERICLFNDDFQYISADRLGPQDSYKIRTDLVEIHRQLSEKKGRCELTPHFLYHYGVESPIAVDASLRFDGPDDVASGLMDQVSKWERAVSPNVNVKVEMQSQSIALKYSYDINGDTTDDYKAVGVGYGLSYTLPIITALLTAHPGALVLIENPEAHLHPGGQAALMELVSKAVAHGVQVLIETHSDHIVHGAQIAIKRKNLRLPDVAIYYMDRKKNENASEVSRLNISPEGRIIRPPKGFFDQIETDLKILSGIIE